MNIPQIPSEVINRLINLGGVEKVLYCRQCKQFTPHVSVSYGEILESTANTTFESIAWSIIGRLQDFNPVSSFVIQGNPFVCQRCKAYRLEGGLISDAANDSLQRDRDNNIVGGYHSISNRNCDKIHIENSCNEKIQVAIHHKDLDNNWKTKGWYLLEPGEKKFIAETRNRVFFTYAESYGSASQVFWRGNDYKGKVRESSEEYGFTRSQITTEEWGTYTRYFTKIVTNADSIYFKNKCSKKIITAIIYKDINNNWKTEGWYFLEPGEKKFIAQTSNRFYYIYAESYGSESKLFWRSNDYKDRVGESGRKYGFIKSEITTEKWGTWIQSFTAS